MDENPYQPPAADLSSTNSAARAGVSANALRELAGTRPWVLFLGAVGLLWSALLLLGACGMIVAGFTVSALFVAAAMYLILGLFFGFACLMLVRFGRAVSRLQYSPDAEQLRKALFLHRRFWKALGIGCLTAIVFFVAGLLIMPQMTFSEVEEPDSEAGFDEGFPEDMDLSEIEDL